MNTTLSPATEPWLRGTHTDLGAIPRAALHALELAREDLWKWCSPLTDTQLHEHPHGLASVAFQLRHIAGSLDRLLTYAENSPLSATQLGQLKSEQDSYISRDQLFAELDFTLNRGAERVRALASADFSAPRVVGRKQLPTTLGGLLVHMAEHTQRHVGQAILTAKLAARG